MYLLKRKPLGVPVLVSNKGELTEPVDYDANRIASSVEKIDVKLKELLT